MFNLPRINKFTYDGKPRVAIELGPANEHACLPSTQLSPQRGHRTFKVAKMMDIQKLGFVATLYWMARSLI